MSTKARIRRVLVVLVMLVVLGMGKCREGSLMGIRVDTVNLIICESENETPTPLLFLPLLMSYLPNPNNLLLPGNQAHPLPLFPLLLTNLKKSDMESKSPKQQPQQSSTEARPQVPEKTEKTEKTEPEMKPPSAEPPKPLPKPPSKPLLVQITKALAEKPAKVKEDGKRNEAEGGKCKEEPKEVLTKAEGKEAMLGKESSTTTTPATITTTPIPKEVEVEPKAKKEKTPTTNPTTNPTNNNSTNNPAPQQIDDVVKKTILSAKPSPLFPSSPSLRSCALSSPSFPSLSPSFPVASPAFPNASPLFPSTSPLFSSTNRSYFLSPLQTSSSISPLLASSQQPSPGFSSVSDYLTPNFKLSPFTSPTSTPSFASSLPPPYYLCPLEEEGSRD
mmetsp:Transcript_36479/g.57235  ORF Transcript_36479/g.57235 Transcript_36479/m.57235 type:complete len:389 (-) Transcript_36479:209-1375(-)